MKQGYFVDWNGDIHSTIEDMGDGMHCVVFESSNFAYVDVIAEDGEVLFTADFHESIEAIEQRLKGYQ